MQSTIIAEKKMPSAESRSDTPFLEVRDLEKRFGGVRALKGVSFTIERGRTYHLMGENGCGKSTLIKIISGAQPAATFGQVLEQAWAESHPVLQTVGGDAGSDAGACGPDGCRI